MKVLFVFILNLLLFNSIFSMQQDPDNLEIKFGKLHFEKPKRKVTKNFEPVGYSYLQELILYENKENRDAFFDIVVPLKFYFDATHYKNFFNKLDNDKLKSFLITFIKVLENKSFYRLLSSIVPCYMDALGQLKNKSDISCNKILYQNEDESNFVFLEYDRQKNIVSHAKIKIYFANELVKKFNINYNKLDFWASFCRYLIEIEFPEYKGNIDSKISYAGIDDSNITGVSCSASIYFNKN